MKGTISISYSAADIRDLIISHLASKTNWDSWCVSRHPEVTINDCGEERRWTQFAIQVQIEVESKKKATGTFSGCECVGNNKKDGLTVLV